MLSQLFVCNVSIEDWLHTLTDLIRSIVEMVRSLSVLLESIRLEGWLKAATAWRRREWLVSMNILLIFGWSLELHLPALYSTFLRHIGCLSLAVGNLLSAAIVIDGLSFGIDPEFLSGRGRRRHAHLLFKLMNEWALRGTSTDCRSRCLTLFNHC